MDRGLIDSLNDGLKSAFRNLNFTILLCALLFALCSLLLAPCSAVQAQQPGKVPRLGWLASPGVTPDFYEAFRQGLRELGYVEGKNIVIEHRRAEKADQLPSLAAELVRLKVDVIFASGGSQSALAAKNATTTIPIVMSNVDDPVAFGLVASLARPGGNVTGLSATPGLGLEGKRLELLKESFPKLSRVAALLNPNHPFASRFNTEYESVAQPLGIKIQSLEIREPADLEQAFSAAKRERAEVLVTINSPLVTSQLKRIVDLAGKSRLPTMHQESRWVEAGGLMSYGTDYAGLYRRSATYVDKILKGTQPANLPVEQPTKFELVINLKTAKQIGVTIPQWTLTKADRVIR
jgi:putative tryptophan/tyrosine transport system substrate-binding protein